MTFLSLTRFRWKTIVLSFAVFYAVYFFSALAHVSDRRDILLQSLRENTGQSLGQNTYQQPKESIYESQQESADGSPKESTHSDESSYRSPKQDDYQAPKESTNQNLKENTSQDLQKTTDQTSKESNPQTSNENIPPSSNENTPPNSNENTTQSSKDDTDQSQKETIDSTPQGHEENIDSTPQGHEENIDSTPQGHEENVDSKPGSEKEVIDNKESTPVTPTESISNTDSKDKPPQDSVGTTFPTGQFPKNSTVHSSKETTDHGSKEETENIDDETNSNSDIILAASWPRPHNGSDPPVRPDVDEYVAFCVAVKDQSRDLPEFLMHHYYNMGVGRFYIMDDGSDPPLSAYRGDYGVPESVLTFDYKPFGKKKVQFMQYALDDRCIKMHGMNHTWMAFIDADEFIETRGNDTLIGILNELDEQEHVGALGINWRIHTSAGLLTRPESSRKEFTQCIGDEDADDGHDWMDNKGIKSIVKVKSYKLPMNPHQFYLKNNQKTVGEHGDILPYGARRTPITRDRIGLHHYAIKSLGEFEEKMTRWSAKGWGYWEHIERYRVLKECKEMQKYEI